MIEFLQPLLNNPVFGGIGAVSLIGYLLYALRKIPEYLWTGIKWKTSCSVSFYSEDNCYDQVNEWLASLEYAKRCRRLKLTSHYDHEENTERTVLTPGRGRHVFWYNRHLLMMTREIPDKGGIGGWKRFEDIHLDVYGPRSPQVVRDIVAGVEEVSNNQHRTSVSVYLYRHRWRLACRKPRRDMDSVVLPGAQIDSLVGDVGRFIDSRKWYQDRGVPYRRGYLLKGPPGCGKTTLVMALASRFERPIYALNLGSMSNDDELIDAVCEVPEHGILLIEDIDAAKATTKRNTKTPQSSPTPVNAPTNDEEKREVSLSALLNVLDGAFSRDGRILVMTTNHPENVDPALMRSGRADHHMTVGPLGPTEVERMCVRFYGDQRGKQLASKMPNCIPASDLQEQLLQLRESQ